MDLDTGPEFQGPAPGFGRLIIRAVRIRAAYDHTCAENRSCRAVAPIPARSFPAQGLHALCRHAAAGPGGWIDH